VDWIKAKDVAEMIGVRTNTVHKWRKRKKGPPFYAMPHGRVRYLKSEVLQWMKAGRIDPAA
jgi:predicted DNA-binding transcriptional regulator AlpA